MHARTRHAGFTLIEVMITVAIVAFLAAIALPSYREQVARSKRGQAQAQLLETAQWLERQYTVSNAYNKKGVGSAAVTIDDTVLNAGVPNRSSVSYTLSFSGTPTASEFTLQMVPTGGMSGDKCGTFSLTNTSLKTVSGAAGSAACWDR